MSDTETDNNSDQEETDPPEPKRRIMLTCGEQTVEVEAPDDLQTLAELAAYFWLMTSPPKNRTTGFAAGSSLVTEVPGPYHEDPECE